MRILIVEDEALVAMNMACIIEDAGHEVVGCASDAREALRFANAADVPDIALVDVNLVDGPTGPVIGAKLASRGVRVLFVTANPRQLGRGVPGALGVIEKPCDEQALLDAIDFAGANDDAPAPPPTCLQPFSGLVSLAR